MSKQSEKLAAHGQSAGCGDSDEDCDNMQEVESALTATAANGESDSYAQEDARNIQSHGDSVIDCDSVNLETSRTQSASLTAMSTTGAVENGETETSSIREDDRIRTHYYTQRGIEIIEDSQNDARPARLYVDEGKKKTNKDGLVQISSVPPLPPSYIVDDAAEEQKKRPSKNGVDLVQISSPPPLPSTYITDKAIKNKNEDDAAATPSQTLSSSISHPPDDSNVEPENHTSTTVRMVHATLVPEENSIEVVEAEPVGCCQKHWNAFASFSCIMLVAFVTLMVLVTRTGFWGNAPQPTLVPSSAPSTAPSFDSRPTLAMVQERGNVRCAMFEYQSLGTFRYQLCQAVAAVVLNNPNALEHIYAKTETRFSMLHDRDVDLLVVGDTHTLEREVHEATTGSPFTFSTPYYYDGMIFAGNEKYVACAENQKYFGECSGLLICVSGSTTDYEYVSSHFSTGFFDATSGLTESLVRYLRGTCNVIAHSHLSLLEIKSNHRDLLDSTFGFGNKLFNNDPLAFVTRPDDTEWSNIVNWALQALFFGEKQGITSDASKCQRSTDSLSTLSGELNYLNAVYCVGNYAEIYNNSEIAKADRIKINTINNGTAMMYVIPYGDLLSSNPKKTSETFAVIKNRTILNCGLLRQEGFIFEDNITASEGLFGMGVSYCQTLASSMLHGDITAINTTTFWSIESSVDALNSEHIDVLFGVPADMSRNFGNQSFSGITFSTPYFYGNETGENDVSFYPVMTRQSDGMFSSFVNCIVLSTFFALDKNIDEQHFKKMPLISLFGSDFMSSLRYAISANGNYDEIYSKNFDVRQSRGRNNLNSEQQPQLLDMPGLDSVVKF